CPYCAEEIQDEAIKCKHCGSTLKDMRLPSVEAYALMTSDERERVWDSLTMEEASKFGTALNAASHPATASPLEHGHIVCPNPNCGYRGPARRERRGSQIVGCFLLLLFIV